MRTDKLPADLRKELALAQARRGRLTLMLYDRAGSHALPLLPNARHVLGRGPAADLPLDDHGVSSLHAMVGVDDEGAWIEDLGSKNGTWVNGEAIQRRALSPGDRITVGAAQGFVSSLTAAGDRAVAGHDEFVVRLDQEVARARDHHRPLCAAMIQAEAGPDGHQAFWATRLSARLEGYHLLGSYSSHCVELLLPEIPLEAADATLRALCALGRPAVLRHAVCSYPAAGQRADALIYALRRQLAAERPRSNDSPALFLPAERWLPPELLQALDRLARSRSTILLCGETGTGKERWARELHDRGPWAGRPFLPVNCASIPDQLVESTLFGHRAGAFTGAGQPQAGVFEAAADGTIFLDGVSALSARAQGALLEVLEAGTFRPIGSNAPIRSAARVIATTNEDLETLVARGAFRADLRFRLGAAPIELPPLRGRLTLISELAAHFAVVTAAENGVAPATIPPAVLELLHGYHWPGNMRELRNVIERGTLLAEAGVMAVGDLPSWARLGPRGEGSTSVDPVAFKARVEGFERSLILEALRAARWNQSAAARALAIPRRTLVHKLKTLGIMKHPPPEGDEG